MPRAAYLKPSSPICVASLVAEKLSMQRVILLCQNPKGTYIGVVPDRVRARAVKQAWKFVSTPAGCAVRQVNCHPVPAAQNFSCPHLHLFCV